MGKRNPTPQATAQPQSAQCHNCGAPFAPGRAECNYCRAAYMHVAAGPRCPRCRTLSARGASACAQCQAPLTQGCLFCGTASPLEAPACVRCHEAFAGMADRKRLRDAQAERAQYFQMAQTGASVAGAVVASGAASSLFDSVSSLVGDLLDGNS